LREKLNEFNYDCSDLPDGKINFAKKIRLEGNKIVLLE